MNKISRTLLNIALFFGFCGSLGLAQTNQEQRVFAGTVTNNSAVLKAFRVTTSLISTQIIRLPPRLATNSVYGTNGVIVRLRTNVWSYTNLVFDSFVPDSLAQLVWTNFTALTNDRDMRIWSTRTHPIEWPTNPPIVTWNRNSLIWGMRGMTALSPSWAGQGAVGQVPLTALTRRHVYARGHGMGADGFHDGFAGKKAWFLTTNDTLITVAIRRSVVRITPGTNQAHRDYTILLLDQDLPETIEPMAVTSVESVQKYYLNAKQGTANLPIFEVEQTGNVSSGVAPFKVNTWKGGDSGSANMIPLPGQLVFFSGRSTSGPTADMQADMDQLCRLEGLNPAKYQMRWVDLGKFSSN